jgi:GWxTD domain-containing protein
MKKLLIAVFILIANYSMAKNLQAHLAHATFYAPGQGSYVETYLSVTGSSVVFAPLNNGKYQAAIEVTMVFTLNNEVKHFDKYNLLSPETEDQQKTDFNFLDQQRIQLPNGIYKFDLTIKDKNQAANPYTVSQEVRIDYHPNIVALSDIEFLESYKPVAEETKLSKGGYELIPLVDNYFPDSRNSLKFYSEIYNSSAVLNNEGFIFSYLIETFENHQVLNSFSRMQRMQSKPVNAIIKEIDLQELPSGNYNLVLEVRNRNNELLSSREIFFQRNQTSAVSESGEKTNVSNTFVAAYTNKDSLAEYIRSLHPISGTTENSYASNQLEHSDIKMMQQFFYDFWEKRDKENPYKAWENYKAEVDKVNAKYSTQNRKGYATDRGRVYLQYGPPNQISENYHEPNSYPYEIWHYYKLGAQTNRKFVFYNPDLVSDFRLIHSDANGEPFDKQWQLLLKTRTETNNDFDREKSRDNFGKQSEDLYRNPR